MNKLKTYILLVVFTAATFLPALALSDEARAMLEKLKGKEVASQTIRAEQSEINSGEKNNSSAKSYSKKIGIGTDKNNVIKILGNPDTTQTYDNRTVLNYGDRVVFLENDKAFNWTGFENNDARFFPQKIYKGCSKEDVINLLGKPVYDSDDYLKYGLYETISMKDGKVEDWSGFALSEKFSTKFETVSNPAAISNPSPSCSSSNYSSSSTASTRPRLSNGDYTIRTGPRGGKYHISASGKKVYHKKR